MKNVKNRWLKACGALAIGGVVMQWGGCGTLIPQVGRGFGFQIGAAPAQAIGCLIVSGVDQTCESRVLPGAIVLDD